MNRFFLISLVIVMSSFSLAYASVAVKKKQPILEVVIFTAKKNVRSSAVKKLALSITPVLKKYPGFISREFSKSVKSENQYLDVVKWKSLEDAIYAAKKIISNKKMKLLIAAMKSYKMYHFERISC